MELDVRNQTSSVSGDMVHRSSNFQGTSSDEFMSNSGKNNIAVLPFREERTENKNLFEHGKKDEYVRTHPSSGIFLENDKTSSGSLHRDSNYPISQGNLRQFNAQPQKMSSLPRENLQHEDFHLNKIFSETLSGLNSPAKSSVLTLKTNKVTKAGTYNCTVASKRYKLFLSPNEEPLLSSICGTTIGQGTTF